MQKIIFSIVLILILLPISQVFSQEYTDTNPTLTVSLNSDTFVYQDSDGHSVVLGLIENNDPLSFITNVVVQAKFFDDYDSKPLEIQEGSAILKVIPPNSKSPFIIRSENPNSNISEVYTKILTFDTSKSMKNSLNISVNNVSVDDVFSLSDSTYNLSFSGILRNGNAASSDTAAHLAFYDVFNRIIQISTIKIGDVDVNELISLKLNNEINSSSVGFLLFSESDKFYSDLIDVEIPTPQLHTNSVTISDVTVKDTLGRTLSEIKIDKTVKIQTETIVYEDKVGKWNETPFTYYVQIKENSSNSDISGKIEYIGKYDGKFLGNGITLQSINWIPEREGSFSIETFVWDANNTPLAAQGPLIQVLVN